MSFLDVVDVALELVWYKYEVVQVETSHCVKVEESPS